MKKRILKLKASMVKNLSTITNTVSKMIASVNSVLNTLTDEDYLRNLSIGIVSEQLNMPDSYVDTISQSKLFSAYNKIPDDFFDMGEDYAESFSNGFLSGVSALTDSISTLSSASVYGGDTKTENVTYNSNYNFYSSGLTVSQQLEQARREEQLKQLRA